MLLNYRASPTCASFMKSAAYGRVIAGPVGSGKTVSCVVELLRRAIHQAPAANGLRYTRFAVVRQTLKQLKDTVLKDCNQWLGGLGEWKVSESTWHLNFDTVRSELVFIPLEDAENQGRLLSMQLTGAWLSEAIEMDISILGPLSGRIGRFPNGPFGVPTWHGLIADTNFPTEMTPWHLLMENPPIDWQIFKQPSGLLLPNTDPRWPAGAENLPWLVQTPETMKLALDDPRRLDQGRKYYQRLIDMYGIDSAWVKRYVLAQYGEDPSGQAVFRSTFIPSFHVVDETMVIPGYPLLIGQDFGRNPWSLICQIDHMGRLLVHEEVAATNVGLEKHINENLRPVLMGPRYYGNKLAIVGDPSGVAKGNVSEESCFDALKRLGLPAFPAPTNDIAPRLRAVEAILGQQRMGGPAMLIDRQRCPMLARAMGGGYRFKKTKEGALKAVPEKNDPEGFSHVCDDLQYVCLVAHGGMMPEIARAIAPRVTARRAAMPSRAWT